MRKESPILKVGQIDVVDVGIINPSLSTSKQLVVRGGYIVHVECRSVRSNVVGVFDLMFHHIQHHNGKTAGQISKVAFQVNLIDGLIP